MPSPRLSLFAIAALAGCSPAFQPSDTHAPVPKETDPLDSDTDTAAPPDSEDSDPVDPVPPPPAPCVAYNAPTQTGTVVDTELEEISGVAVSLRNPGVLWIHEDHLGPNEVTALDTLGNTLGSVVLDGITNEDWEDLAVAPCGDTTCVSVGEIGDNDGVRTYHAVYRFEEPEVSLSGGLALTVTPEVYPYVFPDEALYNSEAMAILPDGRLVIFTKEYESGMSTAYTFPTLDAAQTVTLDEAARFATGDDGEEFGAATTSADLWPDATRLIIRTYGHIFEFTLPGDDTSMEVITDAPVRELRTGEEAQGEAIAYDPLNIGYWTISERASPAIWFTGCARIVP